jgi:hypothetical protein
MNIETAERLHVELLQNLPGTGGATSALSAVVELHRPVHDAYPDQPAWCGVCFNAQEEHTRWPCITVAEVNAYAHVDGIPSGVEAWWRS